LSEEARATHTIVNEVASFAAAIHSQSSAQQSSRLGKYDSGASYILWTECAGPPEIGRRDAALTRKLGLRYSAIDMILDPEIVMSFSSSIDGAK